MATYRESVYKFTDPIRYFKENDPYYWEVDNIPLKQLQENILWLKDQVNVIPDDSGVDFGVSRADINELKPFVDGTGALVLVNPGRYTARVNDAYNKNPLQKLIKVTGTPSPSSFSEFTTWQQGSITNADYAKNTFDLLKDPATASALQMNGLVERILTWDFILQQETLGNTATEYVNWPIIKIAEHLKRFINSSVRSSQTLANEFVKQFRGIARTAIVDVPSSLSIEVPPFDDRDFFYQSQDGETQYIDGATVRIDLLFIYSKPIDVASTTIDKWQNNQPTTILSPQLGLIKGAGVGIRDIATNGTGTRYQNPLDADGNTQILAHVADQSVPTNGFQALNIHGSFPSPDDLMNLAPQIQERFESTDPRLIGQSILPIAYVVVRKAASTTTDGSPILTSADIIDIRPFFRTAELAYNERAGICAAVPSISLANPVATQYNLEKSITDFYQFTEQTYQKKLTDPNFLSGPKLAALGYIYGGRENGPEQYCPPFDADIGWDLSLRSRAGLGDYGPQMKYVDVAFLDDGSQVNGNYKCWGTQTNGQFSFPFLWRKTITVTGIETEFSDFFVTTDWHNCFLLTGQGVASEGSDNDRVSAKFNGIFVYKGAKTQNSVTFTIVAMSSWVWRGMWDDGANFLKFEEWTLTTNNVNQIMKMFYTNNYADGVSNVFNTGTVHALPTVQASRVLKKAQSVFHPSVKYQVYLTNNIYDSYSSSTGLSEVKSLV